jgi:hypothetical protein
MKSTDYEDYPEVLDFWMGAAASIAAGVGRFGMTREEWASTVALLADALTDEFLKRTEIPTPEVRASEARVFELKIREEWEKRHPHIVGKYGPREA